MRLQELTLDELVERSTTAAYPVSRKTWHRWINENPGSFPEPETVIGFACALRVSQQDILNAAAESVGVHVRRLPTDRHAQAVTSMMQDRSVEQQEMVARFVRSFVRTFDDDDRIGATDSVTNRGGEQAT